MSDHPTLPFDESEEWRPIPGYVGYYEASNLGRVRSLPRTRRDGRRLAGRILRASGIRYLAVHLNQDGNTALRTVHSLVAEAFHGPCPAEGMEVRHLDDDKHNNRADNLVWGTRSENINDRKINGTMYQLNLTHCMSGLHEWTAANTITVSRPDGSVRQRLCRECKNMRKRERRREGRVA